MAERITSKHLTCRLTDELRIDGPAVVSFTRLGSQQCRVTILAPLSTRVDHVKARDVPNGTPAEKPEIPLTAIAIADR